MDTRARTVRDGSGLAGKAFSSCLPGAWIEFFSQREESALPPPSQASLPAFRARQTEEGGKKSLSFRRLLQPPALTKLC